MSKRRDGWLVGVGLVMVLCWFLVGINWGLPSRRADAFLFGPDRQPWTGAQIMELAPFGDLESNRGADVDVNPIANRDRPVVLNETDRQRAEIVRRYRLFTYQPDEWNTMRSLAGMRPGEGKLDPRLYQYGGLWVYGVGAMLKAASIIGFVDLKGGAGGLAYYLDHPEAFGRFYVVARLYSALWGIVGAWAVYRLAARVMAPMGAVTAAGCYALMPVVVNQAHEAKPHLAGLALMLLAVVVACRYVETGRRQWWLAAGALCGAAFGMVISSLVIFVIIPLMTLLRRQSWGDRARISAGAAAVGGLVYALTNPYVPYNLVFNREVLRSNLGASTAMYQVAGSANALRTALGLLVEGVSPILCLLGLLAIPFVIAKARMRRTVPHVWVLLGVPAVVVMVQFVALAAGKPGEYGRFALLPDTVLCIAAVWLVTRELATRTTVAAMVVLLLSTGFSGATYTARFLADVRSSTSRLKLAERLAELERRGLLTLAVTAEPAPYCLPPVNLFDTTIALLPRGATAPPSNAVFVRAVDEVIEEPPPARYARWEATEPAYLHAFPSRISWAAKPFEVLAPDRLAVAPAPSESARTPAPP